MSAGLTTLNEISKDGFFESLSEKTSQLIAGFTERAKANNINFSTNHVGGMFGLFFTDESRVTRFEQVMESDQECFKAFFHGMLKEGIYFAPSAFEAGFVSSVHNDETLKQTLDAAEKVFATLK